MVPLAVRPPPRHIDLSDYYVTRFDIDRFVNNCDEALWRDTIFVHMQQPERWMLRLWRCVEANHEGTTAQSLATSSRNDQYTVFDLPGGLAGFNPLTG